MPEVNAKAAWTSSLKIKNSFIIKSENHARSERKKCRSFIQSKFGTSRQKELLKAVKINDNSERYIGTVYLSQKCRR